MQYQKTVLAATLNNFFKCYFSYINLFMFSYFEPNFIEKFLKFCFCLCFLFLILFLFFFFFQILAKIEMTWNKNRLFGHHFETVHFILFYLFIGFFFFRIMIFYSAYINFIAKFWWKSGFRGSMDPHGHQREWKYLGHLSFKETQMKFHPLFWNNAQNIAK